MQKLLLFGAVIFMCCIVQGQTFTGTGGSIPSLSTTQTRFPINITGIGSINSTLFGLDSVSLSITHPSVNELEILLLAPDGTVVPLSIQNGGAGNSYINTCFSAMGAGSIKFASAPFTGKFIPEGYLGSVNNGQNANGIWYLCIQDKTGAGNSGALINWSISFSNTPAVAAPVMPTCSSTLPGSSSCTTATMVCDLKALCGSTIGSSVQDWPGSGLNGSCFGLENNSFIKFVASANTASFNVWVPTNTNDTSGGIQMLFFSGTCGSGAVSVYGCYPHIFPYQSPAKPLASVVSAKGLTIGNTYYLMIDGLNNDNCTFSIAAITGVKTFTVPGPIITSPLFYCQNNTATALTATGNNLLWYSTAASAPGSVAAPVPVTTIAGNSFYYVSQTTNGCESPRSAITVTTSATISPVTGFKYNPDTVCKNGVNPGPVYNLGFTNGGVFSSSTGLSINAGNGNINLAASTPGTYTVTYNYIANGCTTAGSSSTNITIDASTTTNTLFSYNSPTCLDGINPVPATAAAFTLGGVYNSTIGLSINSKTGVINLAASKPGTYQITYSLAKLGCRFATSNFSFITILANTKAVTGFSYSPSAVCPVDNNPVLSKSSGFVNGGKYTATPAGLNINSVTGAIDVATSSVGIYFITYGVPALGCRQASSSLDTFIIRSSAPPVTDFSYNGPVCKSDTATIPLLGISFTLGGIFSSSNGLVINSSSGKIDLTQSVSGDYVIKYALPATACSVAGNSLASLQIVTQPLPPTLLTTSICGTGETALKVKGTGLIQWYSDAAITKLLNAGDTYNVKLSNTTRFYLTSTVGSCGSNILQADVTVYKIPVAPFLGNDTSICKGDMLILDAGIYNGYLWQGGSTKQTFSVTNSGDYKVIVSNSAGCTNSDSIKINVLENCGDINFPTAFSPNADGLNDKFGPVGNIFVVSKYTLKIFNRYGELVFISNNPYQKWEGTCSGKIPSGNSSYLWVATYIYNNKINKVQKGNVMIVK